MGKGMLLKPVVLEENSIPASQKLIFYDSKIKTLKFLEENIWKYLCELCRQIFLAQGTEKKSL